MNTVKDAPQPTAVDLAIRGVACLLGLDNVDHALTRYFKKFGAIYALDLRRSNLLGRLLERFLKIKPTYYVLLSGADAIRMLMMGDPAQIQRGPIAHYDDFGNLGDMDGKQHKQHCRVVFKAFQQDALASYLPHIFASCARRINAWQGPVDVYEEAREMVMDALISSVLGLSLDLPEHAAIKRASWELLELERREKGSLTYRQAHEQMRQSLQEMMAVRRAKPESDALSRMLLANTEISDPRLIEYTYMLLEFGRNDLSTMLAYAMACALHYKGEESKLRAELINATGDALLDMERHLPYVAAFLREVERLHTPVPIRIRHAASEMVFDGFRLPADAVLVGMLSVTHGMESLFPDPERFDPQRFLPPRNEHRTQGALSGFGGGHHMCVGFTFSRLLITVCLQAIIQRQGLALADNSPLPTIDFRAGGRFQRPARKLIVIA